MTKHTVFYREIPAPGEEFSLPEREEEHLFRVFRAAPGDEVKLLDGAGMVALAIVQKQHRLLLKEKRPIAIPQVKFHIYCALPRRNHQDELLKALAELGVWEIHPVICDRSVALSEPTSRWELLLQEACKQSGNPFIPVVHQPEKLEDALAKLDMNDTFACFGDLNDQSRAESIGKVKNVAWFVGPEGGFTREEMTKMQNKGVLPVNLGPWVLRLETAAVAGIAVLRRMLTVVALIGLTLFAGCGKESTLDKHPLKIKADSYRSAGNAELAEKFYLRLFRQKPDSPEVSLLLANFYDEEVDDPAAAWFFYRNYLRSMPGEFAGREEVERCLELARNRLGKSDDQEKLRQENAMLQRQNDFLRKTVANLNRQLNEAKKSNAKVAVKPEKTSLYQVRRGDTLSGIARAKGVSLNSLCRANGLRPDSDLKIGQQLRIPEK